MVEEDDRHDGTAARWKKAVATMELITRPFRCTADMEAVAAATARCKRGGTGGRTAGE